MGVNLQIYRCRIGVFNGGIGPKQLSHLGNSTNIINYSCGVSAVGAVVFTGILLIMGGIEQNPGPTGREYTFRYQYLLMEVGTSMLRKLFDHQVGPDFKQYLDTHTAAKNQFMFLIWKNTITPAQQQYLPPVDNKPSSSNFDITLLCCLLRNVCGLKAHSDVVWIKPASTDTSVEAYVTRLRECRNNLLHSGSVSMPEADLTMKWKELVAILNGLNTFCGVTTLTSLINYVEEMSIDEDLKQRFDETLEAWKQMEKMYDLGIGEVMNEVTTVKHTLTGVKMDTDKLQEDMTNLTEGTKQMRVDITGVKKNTDKLQEDMTNFTEGTKQMRVDLTGVKKNTGKLQEDMTNFTEGTKQMRVDLTGVKKNTDELQKDMTNLTEGTKQMRVDLTGVKKNTDKLQEDITNFNEGTKQMRVDLTGVKKNTDKLQKDMTNLTEGTKQMLIDLTGVKKNTDKLQKDMTNLTEGTKLMQEDLTGVKMNTDKLQEDMTNFTEGTKLIQEDLTGVKMNTDKLQEDMANLTEGTKQMQKDLTGLEKNLIEEIRETRRHNVMTEQEPMSNYSVN